MHDSSGTATLAAARAVQQCAATCSGSEGPAVMLSGCSAGYAASFEAVSLPAVAQRPWLQRGRALPRLAAALAAACATTQQALRQGVHTGAQQCWHIAALLEKLPLAMLFMQLLGIAECCCVVRGAEV
jgi:hypothetical protein